MSSRARGQSAGGAAWGPGSGQGRCPESLPGHLSSGSGPEPPKAGGYRAQHTRDPRMVNRGTFLLARALTSGDFVAYVKGAPRTRVLP